MSGYDLTEAIEAALEAHRHPRRMLTNTSDGNQYDRMEAALEAALPHMEQQIRDQIAAEIEAMANPLATGFARKIVHYAARTARARKDT